MTGMIRVSTHGACFGMVVQEGRVVRAAPICRWAVGRERTHVITYWLGRGARVEVSRDDDPRWKVVTHRD